MQYTVLSLNQHGNRIIFPYFFGFCFCFWLLFFLCILCFFWRLLYFRLCSLWFRFASIQITGKLTVTAYIWEIIFIDYLLWKGLFLFCWTIIWLFAFFLFIAAWVIFVYYFSFWFNIFLSWFWYFLWKSIN